MTALDPIILRQFGWLSDRTREDVTSDPDAVDRLEASSIMDPGYRPPDCAVEDAQIPGPDGSTVTVRVYTPRQARPAAALVWAHGGGFVAGTLDQPEADGVARELVARAQALVVSVGYRLADGETVTYPTLHREVVAALSWTRAHCSGLGLDPSEVQLGGASAGASLAFSATLEALDSGDPLPARLLLIYPLLHRVLPAGDTTHLDVVPEVLRLRQPLLDQLLQVYLGSPDTARHFELADRDPAALPPTLVVVDEYDELRPSGEELVERMRNAGADVTYQLAEGMIHGHLNFSGSVPQTAKTLELMATFLRHDPEAGG